MTMNKCVNCGNSDKSSSFECDGCKGSVHLSCLGIPEINLVP